MFVPTMSYFVSYNFLCRKVASSSQRINNEGQPLISSRYLVENREREEAHSHLLALNDHQDAPCHCQRNHHIADLHPHLVLGSVEHLKPTVQGDHESKLAFSSWSCQQDLKLCVPHIGSGVVPINMKKEVGPGDFVGLRGGQGIFTNHFIYKIRQHIFKVGKKEEEESMKVESEARNKASPQPPKKRPGILISTCYGEPRFWLKLHIGSQC